MNAEVGGSDGEVSLASTAHTASTVNSGDANRLSTASDRVPTDVVQAAAREVNASVTLDVIEKCSSPPSPWLGPRLGAAAGQSGDALR